MRLINLIRYWQQWTFVKNDLRGHVENIPGRTYVSSRCQYWKSNIIVTSAVHSFHRRNWPWRTRTAVGLIVAVHHYILFSNVITSILWTEVLLLHSLQCHICQFPRLPFAPSMFTSIRRCRCCRRHRRWFSLFVLLPNETLKTTMAVWIPVVV